MEPHPYRHVSPPANQRQLMSRKGRQAQQRQRSDKGGRRAPKNVMPFGKRNYILMVAGLVVVGIGYAIMAAEQEVDRFLSLYVSPILLMVGYLEIIYAIVWRQKDDTTDPK